ncbi:hypothetical protein [Thermococcus sp.]
MDPETLYEISPEAFRKELEEEFQFIIAKVQFVNTGLDMLNVLISIGISIYGTSSKIVSVKYWPIVTVYLYSLWMVWAILSGIWRNRKMKHTTQQVILTKFTEYQISLMGRYMNAPIKSLSLIAMVSLLFGLIFGLPQIGTTLRMLYVSFLIVLAFSFVLDYSTITDTLTVVIQPKKLNTKLRPEKIVAWKATMLLPIIVIMMLVFLATPIVALVDLSTRMYHLILLHRYSELVDIAVTALFQFVLLISLASYISKKNLRDELQKALNIIEDILIKLDLLRSQELEREYSRFVNSIRFTYFEKTALSFIYLPHPRYIRYLKEKEKEPHQSAS